MVYKVVGGVVGDGLERQQHVQCQPSHYVPIGASQGSDGVLLDFELVGILADVHQGETLRQRRDVVLPDDFLLLLDVVHCQLFG